MAVGGRSVELKCSVPNADYVVQHVRQAKDDPSIVENKHAVIFKSKQKSRSSLLVSLQNRNYRLFLIGQTISFTGTWMQLVAQAWLILDITHSGTAVGGIFALQFVPMMLLAPYAGVVADRTDKRRLLMKVQLLAIFAATMMGIIASVGKASLANVYALVFVLGLAQSFDNPVRQSFITEMVGVEKATNAVSLNTVMINTTRVLGPALAGFLLARSGASICFFFNAVSYVAAFVAYLRMRPSELERVEPVGQKRGQLREGVRYVVSVPDLWIPLAMIGVVGTLAFNFQVIIPLLVRDEFGRGPGSFGGLIAMSGIGSLAGGLLVASISRPKRQHLIASSIVLGVVLGVFSIAPGFRAATIVALLVGAGAAAFLAVSNSMLQVTAAPEMRGRVLALFSVAFLGSTPLGGPLIGWISEHFGPKAGLMTGAIGAASAGLCALVAYHFTASDNNFQLEDTRAPLS
ncbi:MAG: MFS transporter [Acidimicrobiia bacterium]